VGQKTHPYGFRVGITRPWIARWYARKKDFGTFLVEDQRIKKFIKSRLKQAGLSKIEIERTGDETRVFLFTSRPGVVIGKKGAEIDKIREELQKYSKDGSGKKVQVNIREITKPELDAQLVAEAVAEQLLKRASFRRAVKKSVEGTMSQGALGVKVIVSGRLGGAEIARQEPYMVGALPLHTLTADVDYGFAEAKTTYGVIGIKVWIYKGKIKKEQVDVQATAEA
jgi:small subunit ribosomal protein S3